MFCIAQDDKELLFEIVKSSIELALIFSIDVISVRTSFSSITRSLLIVIRLSRPVKLARDSLFRITQRPALITEEEVSISKLTSM